MKKMNKKGFTLVELLAVIVILGLLMAIAIPSVTKYITQSRKKTLISSIDSYVTGVTTAVNDNQFGALSNESVCYYVPVSNEDDDSCVTLEKGGTDPFGNWLEAYVIVNYDSSKYSYDYWFTFIDDGGYGMKATLVSDLDAKGDTIKNPSLAKESTFTGTLGTNEVMIDEQTVGRCTSITILQTPKQAGDDACHKDHPRT
mgnify:CR=1 FL=1